MPVVDPDQQAAAAAALGGNPSPVQATSPNAMFGPPAPPPVHSSPDAGTGPTYSNPVPGAGVNAFLPGATPPPNNPFANIGGMVVAPNATAAPVSLGRKSDSGFDPYEQQRAMEKLKVATAKSKPVVRTIPNAGNKLVEDVRNHKPGADAKLESALGLGPQNPQTAVDASLNGSQPVVPNTPGGGSSPVTTPAPGNPGGLPMTGNPTQDYLNSPQNMGALEKSVIEDQAKRHQEIADQERQNALDMQSRQDGYAAAEAERQKRANHTLAKIDGLEKEAANMPLNDGGFLRRNPGALLSAVGSIFGGMLAARTGGRNDALDSLNAAIQRDAQDQKDKYNQTRNQASAMRTTYGQMMEQFGDERSATSATELMAQNQVNARLKAMVDSSQSKDLKNQADVAYQLGVNQSNKLRADLLAQQQYIASMTAAGAGGTKGKNKGKQDLDKTDEKWVAGFHGYARSKEDASKLNDRLSNFDNIEQNLQRVGQYWTDTNAAHRILNPAEQEIMSTKLNTAISDWKNSESKAGANLSATEEALLPLKPDEGKDWFDVFSKKPARIKAVREMLAQRRENLHREYGIVDAIEHADPTTNTVKSQLTGNIAGPHAGVRDVGTPQ